MCGIIAIVRRRATRLAPSAEVIASALPEIDGALASDASALDALAGAYEHLNALLSGVPGVMALVHAPDTAALLTHRIDAAEAAVALLEDSLDQSVTSVELEATNAAVLRLKDAIWSVSRDRIRTARAVDDLCQGTITIGTVEAYLSVQEALSAIDRLEVRGRDSAGLHLLVSGHGFDFSDPAVTHEIDERAADPHFGSGSVRAADGQLSFVYKAAAEIGELGDNTAVLREAIKNDELLRRSLSNDAASVTVLGHTRWASVGIISEPNAHPLNSEQVSGEACPYVTAALNGDVDNFADLRVSESLDIAPAISTDAKVIPTLMGQAPRRCRRAVRGQWGRRVIPTHRRRPRRFGCHRDERSRYAQSAPSRASRQRPSPLRRSQLRTPTSWPASPMAWSRSPTATCAWMARRRVTREPHGESGPNRLARWIAGGRALRHPPGRL